MNEKTAIILSIKPRYADLIFNGTKTVELRRRILSSIKNRMVFVYVSSPEKQLRGGFRVNELLTGTPDEIWKDLADFSAIDKQDFDNYYQASAKACALQIDSVWKYENPVDLDILRKKFPNFVAPQSWRHAKPEEYQSFIKWKNQPDISML